MFISKCAIFCIETKSKKVKFYLCFLPYHWMFKIKNFLSLALLMIWGLVGASLFPHFCVAENLEITKGSMTGKSFSFIMPNRALYLYALTEPNTYTIYFDGN